jgi:hypothetical protein
LRVLDVVSVPTESTGGAIDHGEFVVGDETTEDVASADRAGRVRCRGRRGEL